MHVVPVGDLLQVVTLLRDTGGSVGEAAQYVQYFEILCLGAMQFLDDSVALSYVL